MNERTNGVTWSLLELLITAKHRIIKTFGYVIAFRPIFNVLQFHLHLSLGISYTKQVRLVQNA